MQGRRSKLAASKTGDRGEREAMQKNQDGPSKVGKTSTSTDLGIALADTASFKKDEYFV